MRKVIAAGSLLLAACGDSGAAPGPGGVSVDEAAALDQAAEMLDSQRLPPGVLEEGAGDPAAPAPSATPS